MIHRVCVDRGETTSGNLKRDNVEPSLAKVQGVHMKELYFEFRVKKCRGETLIELLNTLEALQGVH
jgi:hypothetical protein